MSGGEGDSLEDVNQSVAVGFIVGCTPTDTSSCVIHGCSISPSVLHLPVSCVDIRIHLLNIIPSFPPLSTISHHSLFSLSSLTTLSPPSPLSPLSLLPLLPLLSHHSLFSLSSLTTLSPPSPLSPLSLLPLLSHHSLFSLSSLTTLSSPSPLSPLSLSSLSSLTTLSPPSPLSPLSLLPLLSHHSLFSLSSPSSEMVVFKEGDSIYHSKMLSFYRKKPFDLVATYQLPSLLPYPSPSIGTFSVKDVKPTEAGEASKIKVKVRMNIHGIFFVKSASLVEKLPVQPEEAMETDKPANATTGGSTDTSDVSQGKKSKTLMKSLVTECFEKSLCQCLCVAWRYCVWR